MNGILLIAFAILIIWAIVAGAGPCLGGALQCLTKGGNAAKTVSGTSTRSATS